MSDSDMTDLMLPRRRFVKGLALGGVLAAMPSVLQAGELSPHTRSGSAPVITRFRDRFSGWAVAGEFHGCDSSSHYN